MNEKQKLFCKYYIENKNVEIAAKNAGYTLKTALKLLKNEKIKNYIENNNIAKSDEVIECLTRIMRGYDENSSKDISVKEKLKAAELLGKMYSIFSPKQEKQNDDTVYILGDDFIKE